MNLSPTPARYRGPCHNCGVRRILIARTLATESHLCGECAPSCAFPTEPLLDPRKPKPAPTLAPGAAWVLVQRGPPSQYEKQCQGPIHSAEGAYRLVRDRILREQVEVLYVLCLDDSGRVTHLAEICRGGQDTMVCDVPAILRIPIVTGSSTFVLVHNHPSGDATPSKQDLTLTREVLRACDACQLKLMDHVVVGAYEGKQAWTSILECLHHTAHKTGYEPSLELFERVIEAMLQGHVSIQTEP